MWHVCVILVAKTTFKMKTIISIKNRLCDDIQVGFV